ncbi:MAG: helix-turn-helix domain-containing protein [Armatimonadetes bacterium]|nr:helix-turn-helix domain-containing protein [Armatimonadota bacterium]
MQALGKHRLLDLDEVAEFLNVSRPTIYRLIRSGSLRSYKVGGRWKFRPEEIEVFLASRSNVRPPSEVSADGHETSGSGGQGSDEP